MTNTLAYYNRELIKIVKSFTTNVTGRLSPLTVEAEDWGRGRYYPGIVRKATKTKI